ncbi:hypothetical protein BDA96_04G128900 [Sorghum bicolor]|uniref:Uncharacterized protein n=1 Tax=Sorghum bicolor TaxID=4558 RepID=A0A921UK33_SORBI|nr:hypothetical protein BDA96_04G128900 [Sorghum bicolor]
MNATALDKATPVGFLLHAYWNPTPIRARIRQLRRRRRARRHAQPVPVPVAQARDAVSGRALELWANQPTMQLYTGNGLNQVHHGEGRQGVRQVRRLLPGDHGVRGRREPPRVPVDHPEARPSSSSPSSRCICKIYLLYTACTS